MTKYKIIDIVHSGRKGIRGEKVVQNKYKNMIGCIAYIDAENIKPFKSVHMILKGHPQYDIWDTSVLVAWNLNLDTDKLEIETVNSIYILQEIK